MPLVWVSRWRGVISMVAPGSATENSWSCARTGSSSATTPAWTACMTSVAVYTLVIDPSWNSVGGTTGAPVATLATPHGDDVDLVAEAARRRPPRARRGPPASSATSPSSRDR